MKKALFGLAVAAAALTGCWNAEVVTSPDVRTFGMAGDVKAVSYTLEQIIPSEEPGAGPEYDTLFVNEPVLAFDAQGRVTLDGYDNVYEYDAEGNFVRGFNDKTVMQRDAQGRIVLYDNTISLDDESDAEIDYENYVKLEISYDAQGRPDMVDQEGWESMCQTKFVYEGDNAYPFRELYDLLYEGWEDDGAVEYEYTAFDEKGNWTERFYTSTIKTTASWDEEYEPEITEIRYRERRTITYWSDKH